MSCTSHKKIVTPATSFEWLTAKVDIDAESNGMECDDLSGQLRIRKDSLLWLSVNTTLGVEVARIKVSTDSLWVVNRIEQTYLAEPLDSLSAQLGMPLSLPLVQTLLLDNNEGVPPVENQTVLLKNFTMGNLVARVRYTRVKLDETTSFPLKITNKMERVRLPNKR